MNKAIDESIKENVLKVAWRMDDKGLVNAYEGNISIKDWDNNLLYITPSGQNKKWLTKEKIAVIDLDTRTQIDGILKYSSELPMHIAAYGKRSDRAINAVIHCHATALAAYAVCRTPLKFNAYPEHIIAFDEIPVVAYGTPGTDAIHEGISDEFNRSDIVILANHGILAVGKTIADALATVEAAEHTAEIIQAVTAMGGTPVNITGDEYEKLMVLRKEKLAKSNMF